MPLSALVADGWTPRNGQVLRKTASGVVVDFGCERPGLLPLSAGPSAVDPRKLAHLRVGQSVVVYVTAKNTTASGKVSLSLTPRARPHLRWDDVVADGCTPYEGHVVNQTDFGTFIDIGTELQGLLPAKCRQPGDSELSIGDAVCVYVRDKRRDSRKLIFSLHRAPRVRRGWDEIVADAHTPLEGVVSSVSPGIGAFLDIGFEREALLPENQALYGSSPATDAGEVRALEVGSLVVAYVIRKHRKSRKLLVSLHRRTVPLISLNELVADGQTAREGQVISKADYGAWVDIGCEASGLVPADEWLDAEEFRALEVGNRLIAYVLTKSRDTGKICLGLRRCSKPKERWAAVISDGQTPYEGVVSSVTWYGIFVDIGCETLARLTSSRGDLASDERMQSLKVGDRITGYVIEKRTDTWKMTVSLDPSETRLEKVEDLVVDGQTGYYGYVKNNNDLGAWVDIGSDRVGVIWRKYQSPSGLAALDALSLGDPVLVYITRRNPSNGRLHFSLDRSPTPRKPAAEVLRSLGSAAHEGAVYHLKHECVHVDFGCEVAGVLSRESAPDCTPGDTLYVKALSFDAERGRFNLVRVTQEASQAPTAGAMSVPQSSGGEAAASHAAAEGTSTALASTGRQDGNHKGQLQNEVQRRLRRTVTRGDVLYTHDCAPDGRFVAQLEVPALPELAGRRFRGEPRGRKTEAEHSAAAAALAQLAADVLAPAS